MKLRLCCLALALSALAAPVFADVAIPDQTPKRSPQNARRTNSLPAARMSIESRNDAKEARLQIPQSLLRQLQRAGLEQDDASAASAATDTRARPTRTIIAGVCLSLSLAFAGVFVARTRGRNARRTIAAAAVALVLFATAGAFAFDAFANARPPEPRTLDAGSLKRATTPDAELNGLIRIEIVPEGGAVKLIVPADATAAQSR